MPPPSPTLEGKTWTRSGRAARCWTEEDGLPPLPPLPRHWEEMLPPPGTSACVYSRERREATLVPGGGDHPERRRRDGEDEAAREICLCVWCVILCILAIVFIGYAVSTDAWWQNYNEAVAAAAAALPNAPERNATAAATE